MSKVLVVDDEAIITMQLEERLSAMGYTVSGMAVSGEEAVDKARRLLPDIVLMDIVMPGRMNGIEAAKIVTDELDIPVVFVTSYAGDAIIEKAKKVRPYGYIVKPFNELEIKATIEVALFRKGTEQQIIKKGKKSEQEKIITIEDPVEYKLDGIVQVPVNEKKGMTFARGLRSILRHDPDKILIGGARD